MSVTELEEPGTFLGDSTGMVPVLMPTKNRSSKTASKTLREISDQFIFRGSFHVEVANGVARIVCNAYGPTEPIATALIDVASSAARVPEQDIEMGEAQAAAEVPLNLE